MIANHRPSRWRRLSANLLIGWLLLSPTGFVGATIQQTTPATYTDLNRFISSDYFLARLGLNPQTVEKRLGDAAYEQSLVRDQLFALTGRRTLTNSSSEMAQYQRLMDNAYAANQAIPLTVGVALTAAQVAQLTSDIVWLVEQRVTLPNGTSQKVLVPQVYLSRLTRDDLTPDGAVISANDIQMVTPELSNSGRMIAGSRIDLASINLTNSGTIQSTQTDSVTTLSALNDLTNAGGTLGGGTLNLSAGNNLINRADSVERTTALAGGQLNETVVGNLGRLVASGDATLSAGQNLLFQGGELSAGGNATLSAQGDLNLGTAVKLARIAVVGNRGYRLEGALAENTGSNINATGNVALLAGNNLNITASTVTAGTGLTAIAGGAINVGTATDQNQYRVEGNNGDDQFQSNSQTAKGSTLTAGTDLNLISGSTLTLEAASVRAKQDVTLSSVGDLSLLAGNSVRSSQGQHKGTANSDSTTLYDQTVQGSLVDAGHNLNVSAGSTTGNTAPATLTLQGSALAAGNDLKLTSTGDLALLAATRQRYQNIQRTEQSKTKLETLNFELEQNRVLLSTLSAGNSLDLKVGGNLAAQTGTKDANGQLQADRMTVNGVIKGTDRQQISVTHTDDKAGTTLNGNTSQVLGNLAAQGIRSGAKDNLSPEALQTGQAAVNSLINSGLLTLKNQPAVQAALNAPTPNGAALTYTDSTGKVSLSVAGQAKVQAVYSQLKLTETFDVKHFADQQAAQIVTLVAAIVLTICTAGAGASSLGAVIAGAGTSSAVMINAAVIGMVSTMTGQLAGGASFDQAFQAGIKAGVTSAITAGVLNGMDNMVNGTSSASPTTLDSAGQTVQAGSNAASGTGTQLTNLERLNTAAYWQQTALNAAAKGAISQATGGSFKDGAVGSVIGSLAATGAGAIGDTTTAPLNNIIAHAALGCAVASASGKDCGAGAVGGAASATLARVIDSALTNSNLSETTKKTIIGGGSVAGSMAVAGALGKDVLTAGNAASNEVLNNYLYHYKGKIIAYDKNDNNKIIELTEQDLRKLAAQNPEILMQIMAGIGKLDAPILVIDASAAQMVNSQVLDLNNPIDKNQIAKESDMGYKNLTDQNTRIYVQTGVDNTRTDAGKSAETLSQILKQPTGYINNGTEGLASDVGEYLPNSLSKKDVLNEYTLRSLDAKGPTLIVTHSAGNEDARKALQAGALYGHQYNNLSFVSVGSPVGASTLKAATAQGGAQFLGQVNDWRDPVTYSKTFLSTLGTTGAVGAVGAGQSALIGASTGPWGLLAIGGGIATGTILSLGKYGVTTYHPLEQYLAKPPVQSILFDWTKANLPVGAGR